MSAAKQANRRRRELQLDHANTRTAGSGAAMAQESPSVLAASPNGKLNVAAETVNGRRRYRER